MLKKIESMKELAQENASTVTEEDYKAVMNELNYDMPIYIDLETMTAYDGAQNYIADLEMRQDI